MGQQRDAPTSRRGTSFAAALLACSVIAAPGSAGEPPVAGERSVAADPSAADEAKRAAEEDERREVHLLLETAAMPRNASLALAGSEAASRALELAARPLRGALDRRDGWGIASRAAWLLWIDLPLAKLGWTLNHEYGHANRYPSDVRAGVSLGAPSLPFLFVGGEVRCETTCQMSAAESLAQQGGGWEADSLFIQRTRAMLYAGERMHHFDAVSYSFQKLGTSLYLLGETADDRLDPRSAEDWRSDPLLYARWLSELEEGPGFSQAAFREHALGLRRGAYWNLADFTLWATLIGSLKGHVVEGAHGLPSPWLHLGPIDIAPSASFTLTPIGPERTLLTGFRVGRRSGEVRVRWSDPLRGDRLVGGGGTWTLGRPGSLVESVSADLWKNGSDTLGARLELSGEWRRSPDSRLGLRWSLGGKSRGYLTGLSDEPGVYAGVGLRALF